MPAFFAGLTEAVNVDEDVKERGSSLLIAFEVKVSSAEISEVFAPAFIYRSTPQLREP